MDAFAFICPICHDSFRNSKLLAAHMRKGHK